MSIAWCSCRLIGRRGCGDLEIRARRSIGARRPATADRTRAAAETPGDSRRSAPMPTFQRWRGRAQHQRNLFGAGAPESHVAGVIARRAVLLERAFVLLVQHDQPEVRRGAKMALRAPTMTLTLRRRRSAANADAARCRVRWLCSTRHVAEAARKRPFGLRRETDLRHQHDRLPAEAQRPHGSPGCRPRSCRCR